VKNIIKNSSFKLPKGVETTAEAKKNQKFLKKAGLSMATVFGICAMYYCLIPALTQNATSDSQYVFFDNGLSKYEGKNGVVVSADVYESAQDTEPSKVEMRLLSDVIASNDALWSSVKAQLGSAVSADNTIKNVNPANVYVSVSPIAVGNYIQFSGWDSGTVYDTVTNYRINSASREWGYDYVDFQWVSPLTEFTMAEGNCYYAPPQLMINRYGATASLESGGEKMPVQLIWEHGDSKGDSSSKPEVDGSWVNPGTAEGRTFYDAVLEMNGEFGSVTDVNDLGRYSQSINNSLEGSVKLNGDGDIGLGTANKVYHTNATFFDYFSDWELAGNPLIDHKTSYTYNNADGTTNKPIWNLTANYNTTGTFATDFNVDSLESIGFRNIGSADAVIREMDDYGGDKHILQLNRNSVAEYPLPSDATNKYFNASIWGKAGTAAEQTVTVELYYQKDGTEHIVELYKTSSTWSDNFAKMDLGSFYLPEGATNGAIRFYATNTYRLDDFELHYEGNGSTIEYVTEQVTETANFPAGDLCGFTKYSGSSTATVGVRTDNGNGYSDDSTYYMQIYGGAVAEYQLPYATGNNISISSMVATGSNNGNGTMVATIYYKDSNGVEQSMTLAQSESLPSWSGWTEMNGETVSLPDGATDISIRLSCGNRTFRVDDFTVGYEKYVTEEKTIASADFATGDPSDYGFTTVEVAGDSGKGNLSITGGKLYSFFHKPAVYTLPQEMLKPGTYKFSMQITDTKYELRNGAVWLSTDGGVTGTSLTSISIGKDEAGDPTGTMHTLEGEFYVPVNATEVKLYFQTFDAWWQSWEESMNTDSAYYDNFTLSYDAPKTVVSDSAGPVTSSVTASYTRNDKIAKDYADYVGVALKGVSTSSETAVKNFDGMELFLNISDSSKLQGANTYSNKENYLIEGKAFSYGKVQLKAIHYKSGTNEIMYEEILAEYEPGTINISETFAPIIGSDSTSIILESEDNSIVLVDNINIGLQLINTEGSFAEGTNTIAYSYQGNLFNDAISRYYTDILGTEDTIIPLYFGSNSWMTGNGRYFDADRHGRPLFTEAQIASALNGDADAVYTITQSTVTGTPVDILDDAGKISGVGAYIMPYSRQYWNTLYGFTEQRDNYPHGFSNSRAVEGLVSYDPSMDIVMLDGTKVETPYFNDEFIEGANNANAVYGDVYRDVDFAFAYNEETGYYEFDSTRAWYATRLTQNQSGGYYMDYYNYDHLVSRNGDDVIYADDPNFNYMGVKKGDTKYDDGNGSSQTIYQFYPFNSPITNDRFATENLMFGMKLDIPFNMLTKEEERNNSMFKFSGDDDVWVYVDGRPVLDIGGTHTAVGGFIDLKNGYGVVGSSFADYTGISESDDDGNITISEGNRGVDQGVTNTEKSAFALLASLDEICISPDVVKNLAPGASTGFVDENGGGGWSKRDSVAFFDDKFTPLDGEKIAFQYQIRRLSEGDELVIDVKFQNVNNVHENPDESICVTFDLTQFELEEATENVDLMEHELSIYYLERGLNSSNFKLAFNFIDPAQREVEKEWADGNSEHISNSDFVDVELWRTEPEEGEASFVFPNNDYALVRAIAHQNDTESVTSKFVKRNDQVTVQFNMNDSGVESATTLTLNSMILSLEAYRQLNASALGMTIYLNDVPVSLNTVDVDATDDDDGDGNVLDPGEFYNPAEDDANFTAVRDTLVTYDDAGEFNYTAIKLPEAENTVVKIVFRSKADDSAPDITKNTWGFATPNTWLVEAYGYDRTEDKFLSVSDQSVLSKVILDYISVAGEYPVTIQSSDMVIAIAETVRQARDSNKVTYNYYAHNYLAYAVASDMSLDMVYTYNSERTIDTWKGLWNGPFASKDYTQDLNDVKLTTHTTSVKSATSADNKVYLIRYQNAKPYDAIGNGITCSALMDCIRYSAPVQIGGMEVLNNKTGWKTLWNNIVESATLNGKTYNYRYFIREVGANSTYGALLSDYKTTYYDAEGNEILPTIVKINGEDVSLYSIDNIDPTSKKGYVKIVNNPITNATVIKDWAVEDESDKIPIVVKIYGENSENEGVITEVAKLSLTEENDYTAVIEALPLYVDDSDPETKGKMTYYASEEISGKYRASYNSNGVVKSLNGSDITVYPLNKATDGTGTLSIKVINQVEGFVLDINKVDEDGTTPLQGAEFVLYEYDEELDQWVVVKDNAQTSDEQSVFSVTGNGGSTFKSSSVFGPSLNLVQTQKQATGIVLTHNFTTSEASTTPKYDKNNSENFMKALSEDDSWFSSAEGIQLADDLVSLQITPSDCEWGLKLATDYGYGGWQKRTDDYLPSSWWYHATIDNNITTAHIRYLARAYRVTGNERYKQSVIMGIESLLNYQYDNGGWPSIFALDGECPHTTYQSHITYNDNAMIRVMDILLEVSDKSGDFANIVDSNLAERAKSSVRKGIDCILETQIELDGTLTAWCQQHYEDSNYPAPAPARAHELVSLSANESVGIIDFLNKALKDDYLSTDGTDYTKAEIEASVESAVQWINDVCIKGYTYNKSAPEGESPLTNTGNEGDYLWARYYAIEPMQGFDSNGNSVTIQPNQPFFVERSQTQYNDYYSYKDGNYYITVFSELSGLPDLSTDNQQKSYSWYGTWGRDYVLATYKPIASDTVHVFKDSGASSGFFEFAETGIATADTLIYGELELNKALKVGSSQQITFTVTGDSTLRLIARMRKTDTTGTLILTSDEGTVTSAVASSTSTAEESLIEFALTEGQYTLTRSGSEVLLYYMEVDFEENTIPPGLSLEVPEGAKIFTSDENGKILIGGLNAGKYCLVEVKPPIGYAPYKEFIEFTVSSDENDSIRTDVIDYKKSSYVKLEWSDTNELTLTATIMNKPYNITIPATGGGGIIVLLLIGVGVLITAVILYIRKRPQSLER